MSEAAASKSGTRLIPGESRQAKGGFRIEYADGGRVGPDVTTKTRDCGARAVAIVTGRGYVDVCEEITADLARRKIGDESVKEGLRANTVLAALGPGWKYRRDNAQVRRFHVAKLPAHRDMIIFIDDHFSAILDREIRDTGDHSGPDVHIHGYFYRAAAPDAA